METLQMVHAAYGDHKYIIYNNESVFHSL